MGKFFFFFVILTLDTLGCASILLKTLDLNPSDGSPLPVSEQKGMLYAYIP